MPRRKQPEEVFQPISVHYDAHTLANLVDSYVTLKDNEPVSVGKLPWTEQRDWQSYYTKDAEAAVAELPDVVKKLLLVRSGWQFTLVVTLPYAADQIACAFAQTGITPDILKTHVNSVYTQPIRSAYFNWMKNRAVSGMFNDGKRPHSVFIGTRMDYSDRIMLVSPVQPHKPENDHAARLEFGARRSLRILIYLLAANEIAYSQPAASSVSISRDRSAQEEDLRNLGISGTGDKIKWQPSSEFARRLKTLTSFSYAGTIFPQLASNVHFGTVIHAGLLAANQGKAEHFESALLAAFPNVAGRVQFLRDDPSIPNDQAAFAKAQRQGVEYVMNSNPDDLGLRRDPFKRLLNTPAKSAGLYPHPDCSARRFRCSLGQPAAQ